MSKERLGEIPYNIGYFFNDDENVLIKKEDYEWLYEQAKQIEKWNDYNNQVIIANVKLKSQNKRYRESIEKAIDKLTWNSVESEKILLDALESESNE